jgi:hypothetical protein
MLRLSEKVSQPSITGERDVDALVGVATAAAFQREAAGLDVPEPGRDQPPVRQGGLAVGKLTRQRQGGSCWSSVDTRARNATRTLLLRSPSR